MYFHYTLMQTSIAIDKGTKDRAAKRAQSENMPLAAVVRVLLSDYADGRLSIGVRMASTVLAEDVPVDRSTQRKMDDVVAKLRGKIRP